jgi:mitogen-activated protein kinase organizer 1
VSGSEFITGSVDGYVRSYDIRMGQLVEDYFEGNSLFLSVNKLDQLLTFIYLFLFTLSEDPVTSIHLLKDSKTMAVSTLNSTIRLMDRERGEMLQKFTGHRASSYRSHISMSYDEAHVFAGDEDGLLWAWDLESVSSALSLLIPCLSCRKIII